MFDKDEIYKKHIGQIKPFSFDQHTAVAFDDMSRRSIPFYSDLQLFIAKIAGQYYQPKTNIYDIGCSTGNTLLAINNVVKDQYQMIAVDKSEEMIAVAKHKCHALKSVIWECKGAEEMFYDNASIVNIAYVLQFMEPDKREPLLKAVFDGLNKGGVLILSEKTCSDDPDLNIAMIDYYYDFKRSQGYSELEIRQKEEALKDILIPFTLSRYDELLMNIGFSYTHIIFKYMNFVSMIAFK